jgi:hypothetical protein
VRRREGAACLCHAPLWEILAAHSASFENMTMHLSASDDNCLSDSKETTTPEQAENNRTVHPGLGKGANGVRRPDEMPSNSMEQTACTN